MVTRSGGRVGIGLQNNKSNAKVTPLSQPMAERGGDIGTQDRRTPDICTQHFCHRRHWYPNGCDIGTQAIYLIGFD